MYNQIKFSNRDDVFVRRALKLKSLVKNLSDTDGSQRLSIYQPKL